MEILDYPDGVSRCASIVKQGGVVVFPTDTVYGIGCDPYSDSAVSRIFSIKGRQEDKPLPVLAASIQDAQKLVRLGKTGTLLAKKFWPGALTIVAPLADSKISAGVLAGKKSLAVRVPAGNCTLQLLSLCKYLVGTSANPSGRPSPKTAQEVSLTGYDAILVDAGALIGTESTIVDVTGPRLEITRQGAISAGDIQKAIK
ncbi:MAG TPA: L-threonylcarbamoyladenylate synthase [Nitrososphaera sp.]|jgi:L-threonylcarbamoyladenylate synthase